MVEERDLRDSPTSGRETASELRDRAKILPTCTTTTLELHKNAEYKK